ncbi:MAG: sulfate ABC transporter substrate-binding protein [Verrucomicrobia bacterium]|nr:sulfate ABC transporter substrate-binding protein [Verrucomicrobiota bacterium]
MNAFLRWLFFSRWTLLLNLVLGGLVWGRDVELLNVSFDISRELFQAYNPVFVEHWRKSGGGSLVIQQSHAGSSKQARAVIDGLEGDVVTFNLVSDIEALASRGLVAADWRQRFPNDSSPFTSTIVFLTRRGNPKGIRDWSDLARPGVSVIVPNPKTSGNGKYSYLAAYGYALRQFGQNDQRAREFVASIFRNVPVMEAGGRAASTTFVQREIGDVLLTFEAEVLLNLQEFGTNRFERVTPTVSVQAEMPVAVVERVAKRRGTLVLAKAYLDFLFTEAGQDIAAQNYYRPRLDSVARRHAGLFPALELLSVDRTFGGWRKATEVHFAEGGVFDQVINQISRR